jgi:glycosyltransferase involved in cell wall biosynthesis
MPTYNGARFLRPAIESTLNQTFPGFELIVINDASTDGTPQLLGEFKDDRLRVISNERNLGIAASTNKGLALARGDYVALQDHDDISLRHRFQRQVDFLNTHPNIALVGSAAILIDETGVAYGDYFEPADDIEIKWEMLFRCPIRHTSVMARRTIMSAIGGYSHDPLLKVASDYDLLSRIAMQHGVENLVDRLVMWRRHPGATSVKHEQAQLESCKVISRRNVARVLSPDGNFALQPDQQYGFDGSRAFACSPAGTLPSLPPDQVISGMHFLSDLFVFFCRKYNPSREDAAKLRKRLNWTWGKHAIALSLRAPWNWGNRSRMLTAGIGCLTSAASPGGGS